MFTDEVNPLVHTKAHLASPALLKAVKVLRENLEGLQAAWDYDPDGVDEKTWLEQPIQNFITAVHSDMYELRRQLWPHAPFRWLRDAWFQWGLRARKKVKYPPLPGRTNRDLLSKYSMVKLRFASGNVTQQELSLDGGKHL